MEKFSYFASDSIDIQNQLKETGEKIRQTDVKSLLHEGLEKFNDFMKSRPKPGNNENRQEQNKQALRHFLNELGRRSFGEGGKTLNEQASEFIGKIRPDLKNTDFGANPAGTIYYFLALDPRGFAENVKLIRGPLGAPMTLKEAYEYYTRTNPEKAAKILILLETLQKIGSPTNDENQIEIILKAIKTNIDLINEPEKATYQR